MLKSEEAVVFSGMNPIELFIFVEGSEFFLLRWKAGEVLRNLLRICDILFFIIISNTLMKHISFDYFKPTDISSSELFFFTKIIFW